jgi:hypothetical protein
MALLRAWRDRGQYHLLSPQRGRHCGKWLAMLKEIAPHPTRAASIACAKNGPYDYFKRSAAIAAPRPAIELMPSPVESDADIERVIDLSR